MHEQTENSLTLFLLKDKDEENRLKVIEEFELIREEIVKERQQLDIKINSLDAIYNKEIDF